MIFIDSRWYAIGAMISFLALLPILGGCGTAADPDGDLVDADTFADADAESDGDSSLDADSGGDAERVVDADDEIDAEQDSLLDGDTEADSDADLDAETDAVIDADVDTESDMDADMDPDRDGDIPEGPLEPLFSFVVMADSHVTGSGESADRLTAAVTWINDHAVDHQIEVVLVLGDIAWGGGLELARGLLDELDPPYVPINGDNEIAAGSEEAFAATFSDQYDLLELTLDGWQRTDVPVWNPVIEGESWFANMAFDIHGVQFVLLDLASRDESGLASETGDLHDFDGGTWNWFEGVFELLPTDISESIVTASHIPMHLFALSAGEMRSITSLLGPYGDSVYANFAGHVHLTYEMPVPAGGYRVYVTDATHDDENTLRVVHVEGNGVRFAYTHELVVVE